MYLVILAGYWLLFWQRFLRNPYLLSTSEIASTYFPFWIWLGLKWRATDNIYFRYSACIPFLSMFYWPSILAAKLARFLTMDRAFQFYTYFILVHYLLASMLAYKALGLFGAITLTYAGYCIKPQTPSFVYTACWIPGMLIHGPIGVISCAMAVLGGYWPILVYVIPVIPFVNPGALWGLFLGLPQILPFLWYWPKSVRAGEQIDRKFGRIPWWKLKDLVIPTNNVAPTSGVHYPEVEMYMGIAPLLIWHLSWWWIPFSIAILVCLGLMPSIQRIPTRSIYLLTLSLTFLSSRYISHSQFLIPATLLQSWLYIRNSSIYPSFPFSQWWDKPSKLFLKPYNGTWPHVTGYIQERSISRYQGAFSLRESW